MRICATVLLGPGSETAISDAVESTQRSVDGIVFIESGGGQAALDAALDTYRARFSYIEGVSFAWTGSYSDARNHALAAAEAAGGFDYAVTLDPDERLSLPPNLREILAKAPDVKVWSLRDRDLGYCKERVLKCNAGLRWHGRVCENVFEGPDVADTRQLILPGHFWELPKSPEGERRRWERGVIETRRMIDEGDDRYKWWRHQGSCHAGLGNMDEAHRCHEEALKRASNPEETAWSTYLVCEQLVLKERFQEAHDRAAMALSQHAGFVPEFGWIMAYTQFKAGNLQNASRWAQLVTSCPVDTSRVGNRGTNCKAGAKQLLTILHSKERPDFVEISGVRVAVTPRVSDFMVKVMMAGQYEAAEARLLDVMLRPEDRVLELGAGCGYLATLSAKKGCAVMAVEADPDLADVCAATFRENSVAPGFLSAAVADREGSVLLNRYRDFWSSKLSDEQSQSTVEVQAVTLAGLVAEHAPTVIVCDIEGAERHITNTELPREVRAVLIEVHTPELERDVNQWLTGAGFACRSIQDRTILYERAA